MGSHEGWRALVRSFAELPAREDRHADASLFAGITADRLGMAIGRACRDADVPHFSPHGLRHRRISLLHRQGGSWAEIGEQVGHRSRVVIAGIYTHALIDSREIDRTGLLKRARGVHPLRTHLGARNLRSSRRVLVQHRPGSRAACPIRAPNVSRR